MSPRTLFLLVTTLALAAGCERAPADTPEQQEVVPMLEVRPLMADATPLREWFEANAGKPRFVTLVSPT